MNDALSNDARRLRFGDDARREDDSRDSAGPGPAPGAAGLLVATTTLASYPTAAARFYAVVPQSALGAEVEGGSATVAARSGHFFALNLGTVIPPSGTQVVVTRVPHRWVFRYDG